MVLKNVLRKMLSISLCAVFAGSAAALIPAFTNEISGISVNASDSISDGFVYEIHRDKEIWINGYSGTKTNVVIPEKINGKPVTTISLSTGDLSQIKSIKIPSTVTWVVPQAFSYCSELRTIIVDSANPKYTSVDGVVFSKDKKELIACPCGKKGVYTVPSGVKVIADRAFKNCTLITDVVFSDSVERISEQAFYGCTNYKKIKLGKNVNSIEHLAFNNTAWERTLPKGDVYLDQFYYAYNGTMPSGTTVRIKDGTKFVAASAFADCDGLKGVVLPDSLQAIGDFSFKNCINMNNITLPKNISRIGEFAFEGCSGLQSIVIPDKVTEISSGTFAYCDGLKNVTFPNKLEKIQSSAFDKCYSIEKVNFPDTLTYIGIMSFRSCRSIKTIKLPYGLIDIGTACFLDCQGLKSITVPKTVDKIFEKDIGYYYDNNGKTVKMTDIVIYGSKGSAAQKYAEKYGFKFAEITEVTSVTLNKTTLSLGKGESFDLKATVSPANPTYGKTKWSSSDTKVVTVDQRGHVKTVSNGTASVAIRTEDGKEKSCKITVKNSPDKITLDKTTLTLGLGESYKLGSQVNDGAACSKRTYQTDNSNVIKMTRTDWQAEFTAQKTGTANVKVYSYNGKSASCKVTVKPAPKTVSLNKTQLTLGVGETYKLSAVLPSGTAAAVRTFSSSNNNIVKMTKTNWEGEFKALKAGTAVVKVRLFNGKEASCKVTVKKAPEWVALSKNSLSLKVGQTASLSAYVADDAGCASRTFRSSDSSIIKMTKTNWTGEFKAMKKGTAWVTVRLYNGKEKSCKITVTA